MKNLQKHLSLWGAIHLLLFPAFAQDIGVLVAGKNQPTEFSFNHQVGYESASYENRDPLAGALVARKMFKKVFAESGDKELAHEVGRKAGEFFFKISNINIKKHNHDRVGEEMGYRVLSEIPVIGSSIPIGVQAYGANSKGLAYGSSRRGVSVSPDQLDRLLYNPGFWEQVRDNFTGVGTLWNEETQESWEKLQKAYPDLELGDVKEVFRQATLNTSEQTSPENLAYAHRELQKGKEGILGCDPSTDCQRFKDYQLISRTPGVEIPGLSEHKDEVMRLRYEFYEVQSRLDSEKNLSIQEKAELNGRISSIQKDIKGLVDIDKVQTDFLKNDLMPILEKWVNEKSDSYNGDEVKEMLDNPVMVNGEATLVPKESRAEFRMINEALNFSMEITDLFGGGTEAHRFFQGANAGLQFANAMNTVSKLFDKDLNLDTLTAALSSGNKVVAAVKIFMAIIQGSKPDPMQLAFEEIFKNFKQVLDNQKKIMKQLIVMDEKLDVLRSGQKYIILQLSEVSREIDQLHKGQASVLNAVRRGHERANCDRLKNKLDSVSRQGELWEAEYLHNLQVHTEDVFSSIAYNQKIKKHTYEKVLGNLSNLAYVLDKNGVAINSLPVSFDYENVLSLPSNSREETFVFNGDEASRMQSCGNTIKISLHDRRGMIPEIFSKTCEGRDCGSLYSNLNGSLLHKAFVLYLKSAEALSQSSSMKEEFLEKSPQIHQLFRSQFQELSEQESEARKLLPTTLKQYSKVLEEVESWITYALQLDIASAVGVMYGVEWARGHTHLPLEDYILEAGQMLDSDKVKSILYQSFFSRGEIGEYLNLGRIVEADKIYWYGRKWLKKWSHLKEYSTKWVKSGRIKRFSDHYKIFNGKIYAFVFDTQALENQLASDGVEKSLYQLNHIKFKNPPFSLPSIKGQHYLLDAPPPYSFEKFGMDYVWRKCKCNPKPKPKPKPHNPFWEPYYHNKPFGLQKFLPLSYKIKSDRNLYHETIFVVPRNREKIFEKVDFMDAGCRYGTFYCEGGRRAYQNASDSRMEESINNSGKILASAVQKTVSESILPNARNDWETYMDKGINGGTIPTYKGWRIEPRGYYYENNHYHGFNFDYEKFKDRRENSHPVHKSEIVGINSGLPFSLGINYDSIDIPTYIKIMRENGPKDLPMYRKIIHENARKALAKLTGARLAVLTALELGYNEGCIQNNLNLRLLYSSILQGQFVSGGELISINDSKNEGGLALDRLIFSRKFVDKLLKDFENKGPIQCESGYYSSKEHMDILSDFEKKIYEL